MSNLVSVLQQWVERFQPSAAGGVSAVFEFQVDQETQHILLRNGQCSLESGEHNDPDATLRMNLSTLQAIASGELDGMAAFLSGDIEVDGDVMLAARLTEFFPPQ
ncbi:SCP2 sterol-binding domain-containing protein [Maribrevibacterium harenarium]|uniref:SCP2 sterol-binding domain-containing protein n=1 Tax=Maribrevibacterium harenarium TaxID=2589817 RepID=A0A501WQ37_9GAMM|nr:SCP2 sterol-binding domain-containing protein [Maribrevibacterium harenarium]TPE51579.1 SCP2 sterol-binding domain-containing protein [Maribrevibacterium harenarium]